MSLYKQYKKDLTLADFNMHGIKYMELVTSIDSKNEKQIMRFITDNHREIENTLRSNKVSLDFLFESKIMIREQRVGKKTLRYKLIPKYLCQYLIHKYIFLDKDINE